VRFEQAKSAVGRDGSHRWRFPQRIQPATACARTAKEPPLYTLGALPLLAFSQEVDHWAAISGLVLLGVTLFLAVWFYRHLAFQIKRSEAEFHELLESAPFAIAVTNREAGHFLFANRRAIELLGLSPTQYHTQRVPYANGQGDRARIIELIARDGGILDSEIDLIAMNGRRFPSLGSIVPIEFAGQQALIGAFQDVSDLKAKELQVRASETRLRALLETVPDGIVVLKPDGTILQASQSCFALIGIPVQPVSGNRNILDYIPETERTIAHDLLAKVAADQPHDTIPYRIPRPDGYAVWIEPRGVRINDPITNQPFILLVLRNITQRREAQEQLAEQVAKLKDALDRIAHLQNAIVSVCAWTKRVKIDGKWIPIDHYLAKYLGLKISHGISEEGLAMLGMPEEPKPPETKPES
jgi:PAS domain S-box-containing protein